MLARFACPKICEDLGASTLQSVSARRARQLARLQLEVGISAATDQPPGNAPINVGVGLADDAALVASVASSDCAECPDHSSQATSHEQKKAEMIRGASGRLTALAVECRGAAEAAVAENVAVIEAHWAEAALLLKPPPSPPPSPPSRAIEGGCVEDESAEALSNMAAGETSYCPNQRNKLPLPRGLPRPLPISLWILLPNSSIPPPPHFPHLSPTLLVSLTQATPVRESLLRLVARRQSRAAGRCQATARSLICALGPITRSSGRKRPLRKTSTSWLAPTHSSAQRGRHSPTPLFLFPLSFICCCHSRGGVDSRGGVGGEL